VALSVLPCLPVRNAARYNNCLERGAAEGAGRLVTMHRDYHAAVAYVQSLIRGSADAVSDAVASLPLGARSPEELLSIRRRRLARMRMFLGMLDHPEDAFHSVHVGGTSGKGSTAAFIHAILHAAGKDCGLHTTPYLQIPLEKLVIGDRYYPPSAFASLVNDLKPFVARMEAASPYGPLSYGELWVALTFACFARQGCEYGVVEVGHGGRWDYTNVLSSSVAVITSIGFDHMRSLGATLPAIAHHKAGIIKRGRPAIVGVVDPEAMDVIMAEASAQDAPLWRLGHEFRISSPRANGFDYHGRQWRITNVRPSLTGPHQIDNAALAIAAVEALGCLTEPEAQQAVPEGVRSVRFPGRLEVMQRGPTVVLDGAHNTQKVRALAVALGSLYPSRPLHLVFGALAAKQADEMLAILAPLARSIRTTAPTVYHKTAADPDQLASIASRFCSDTRSVANPPAAIDEALRAADQRDVVCATGSLYLVGEARERWISSADLLAAAERGAPAPRAKDEVSA